ncbi:hypothetical protein BB560_007207 [Smittium megazygosporum]|uniref:Uncharacterized protein n=1 Tax=Smittium megazygosporum TaxID=133381 RepID=A0A2T9XY21_9FUNG|nr:hypothetical protein BB560_007207 [Smittium megazygosporum]
MSSVKHSANDDNEALKRAPVEFQNELRTKEDFEAFVAQMKKESQRDSQKFISTLSTGVLMFVKGNNYPVIPFTQIKIKSENSIYFCELIVLSIQAASQIAGRDTFGNIAKSISAILVCGSIYAAVTTMKYSLIEAWFWFSPSLLLIFSVLSKYTMLKNFAAIEKYEKSNMKKFT